METQKKHQYHPSTFEVAMEYVLEITNDGGYYHQVTNWFRNDYVEINNRPSSNFPYKPTGYNRSYLQKLNTFDQNDRAFFADIVRQIAFNHYSEEFLSISRRPEFNLEFKQIKQYDCFGDPQWEPEIAAHIEKAEQHFKIVENTMNTLDKYKDQASANVHLIHGRPADSYTESELMSMIREAQKNKTAIADLVETSERMKAKSAQYDADIAVYVAALDALN